MAPELLTHSLAESSTMEKDGKSLNRNQIASLIRGSKEFIIDEWATRALNEAEAAAVVDKLSLIDSMPDFLDNMADYLDTAEASARVHEAAKIATRHGEPRASVLEYTLEQVIFEFQILRDVLFTALEHHQQALVSPEVRSSITQFIDYGIRQAAAIFAIRTASYAEKSKQELYSFMMQSPSPFMILLGPEFRFFLANPAYERYAGRKVRGKTVIEAFTAEEVRDFLPILEDVYKIGKPYIGKEIPLNLPDAEGIIRHSFINLGFHAYRGEDGTIKGIIADVQDVTEQVQARHEIEKSKTALEAEKFKLESIFNFSPAAMAMWRGPDLIFEKINPEYQRIFGDRQLIGKPFLEALPEFKDQVFGKIILDVLNTGEGYFAKDTLARIAKEKDGSLEDRYYDFAYVRINDTDGNPYGVYNHSVDVTAKVLAQQELEKAADELLLAKNDAERANSLKSSFLANMSHEIRTPLGAIIGFTDLLREGNLHQNERRQYLDTISRNGKALTRIIDDILDLAKVESGKLEMEKVEFSFHQLVDDVTDIFRERTKSKGLYLRSNISEDVPAKIISDPTRLRQILINIIGNAVKFTQSGGVTINVKANITKNDTTKISISVTDTGIGLTEEQKEKLFEPFMQADNSTTRKFGGTGLGLALSTRLAHALDGNIKIEKCVPAKGCTFVVSFTATLPLPEKISAISENRKSESYEPNPGERMPLRILVADDSPDNQQLVRILLQRYGYTVETAKNGLEAVKMAHRGNFDLILMDIQMPVMDGYEATRQLRASGYKQPIIALTAHAMAEERARTMAAGCNGHLTKPLDKTELLRTIQFYASKDSKRENFIEQ